MHRPRLDSLPAPIAIVTFWALVIYVLLAGVRDQKLATCLGPNDLRITFRHPSGEPWSVLFETQDETLSLELKSGTFQWDAFPGVLKGTIDVADDKKVAFKMTVDLRTELPTRLVLGIDCFPTVRLRCDGNWIDIETNLTAGPHLIVVQHP
jgi:hypothetical protein